MDHDAGNAGADVVGRHVDYTQAQSLRRDRHSAQEDAPSKQWLRDELTIVKCDECGFRIVRAWGVLPDTCPWCGAWLDNIPF
jgi:rubrerythrin